MATPVQIENLPEEMGEEIALSRHDDGTISSRMLGSTANEELTVGTSDSNYTEAESKAEDSKDTENDEESDDEVDEREFDKNPTVLYALVQKKLWKETIARAKSNAKEARAFISRREKDGRIRWRLLPLHAAIVFKAPEEVIEALVTAFPKAAKEKDDQGMMPLHLAFRNGATEGVVNLLLVAFPESVDSPDRKGRVPLTLAKAAASPNREIYTKALEKGPSHYAVAAIGCARERIIAERKEIFEAQLKETLEFHESAINKIEANAEKKQKEIQDTVQEKEVELLKLHENSQVLVDHVASLEAQMNTRSDTERFLATKIAKLEEKLKSKEAHIEEREAFWGAKLADVEGRLYTARGVQEKDSDQFENNKIQMKATIDGLSTEVKVSKNVIESTQKQLEDSNKLKKEKQDEWDMKEIRFEAKYAKIEIDWANSQANVAILESQLKKRMEIEHLLANQVSNLASRLAESSDSNLHFSEELKGFEQQKSHLETNIQVLKQRLQNVTEVMEITREQQMKILDDAIAQEEMMAQSMESHAQTVSEQVAHEKELQETKDELMELIEHRFSEANEKRAKRLNISTGHGRSLSSMNASRHNVLSCAQTVASNVIGALEKDLNLDTLSYEVEKIQAEKRRIRSTATVKESNDGVVINEVEKTSESSTKPEEKSTESIEETPTECPTNPVRETEDESVVVVSSLKKSLNATAALLASVEKTAVEQRTEMDEERPEETASDDVHVDRVAAAV